MKVFRDLESLPNFKNAVITVGSFDGVHLGHQKILKRIQQLAREIKGESIVITFDPHPRQVIYPKDKSLSLLNTIDEKIDLLERFHIDNLVIVPFSIEFSQQLPREYIEKFLIAKFQPKYIVIGYDHRFGQNRQGSIELLRQYCKPEIMDVIEIPKQEIEDIAISSTKIREAISSARFDISYGFLNYLYPLTGKVIEGNQIGSKLGYPTANIKISNEHKLLPPEGIYACYTTVGDVRYKSMLYLGRKPSISDNENSSIEVNIFDFNNQLYGDNIRIDIVGFLRNDQKFDNLDALKSQLHRDKIDALQMLEQLESQKKEENKIDIVILNYNGREFLESYLPQLLYSSESHPFSITIADNASTDDSIEYIQEYYPELKTSVFTRNYGFAGGYNKALEHSVSEYTVILNSDVKVQKDWLDPIIKMMDEDKTIAACQPKVLSLEEPEYFEYAGAAGGLMDWLGYPFCRGRVFENIEKDEGQYDTNREIFWASGAAMVIRTELYQKFGGFDASYFAHQEEIDLCWRLKRAGYKIFYVSESTVYHLGGGTLSYDHPQKVFLNFRNNLTTIFKNEFGFKLFFICFLRLFLDGAAGILFLSKGKFQNALSVIKAHFAIYFSVFKILARKRYYNRLVDKYRIGKVNSNGKHGRSIVSLFFLRGKKTYKEMSS